MDVEINLAVALLALVVEATAGYSPRLYRAVGHPVTWLGGLIDGLDRRLNSESATDRTRRLLGTAALLMLLVSAGLPAALLQALLLEMLPTITAAAILAVLASTFLAQRSLWVHVAAVGDGLEREGIGGGRKAVAEIVGRDPESLDEPGVIRAALESLSENFSDGVVAPAFWCAVFGLPGIAAYKAVNTADSMIGHRTLRHQAFGWAAARLDDLVNLPASRLAALWLVLAALLQPGASAAGAARAVWRDAGRHRSPNAGWPEAAMAGALGLRLAGPRSYGGRQVEDHWMGNGRAEATIADLRRGLALYRTACAVQMGVVLAVLTLVIWRG